MGSRRFFLLLCAGALAASVCGCSRQGEGQGPNAAPSPSGPSEPPSFGPSQVPGTPAPSTASASPAAPDTGADGITADAARDIALAHAGLSLQEAAGLRVEQDWDHGQLEYEIEFWGGAAEYDYTVRASDGAILKQERDVHGTGGLPAPSPAPSGAALIGETAAQDAALAHAGCAAGDTDWLRCWLEYDDGAAECYEVEFAANGVKYEYKIGLYDGAVLKCESGHWSGGGHHTPAHSGGPAPSQTITADAARDAALAHAGVSLEAACGMKMELDHDEGRAVYEVEFKSGAMEYEYELDALTGAVLKYESEYDG